MAIKMAYLKLHIFSNTLEMATQVDVILPERYLYGGMQAPVRKDGRHPVLYLLHGGGDDNTRWVRFTSLERYVTQYGLMVVCPNGLVSRYTNMAYGWRFHDYIAKELPEIISSMFYVSPKREDTYIAGLSMGGTGALTIGLSQPEKYACIGVLSAGNWVAEKMYTPDQMPPETIAKRVRTNLICYGVEDTSELLGNPQYDAFEMARRAVEKGGPLPRIFHSIGTEDHKYENVQKTRRFFEDMPGNPLGYAYHEGPGRHEWKVWDHWIQEFLKWADIRVDK